MIQVPEGPDTVTKALFALISLLVSGILGLLGIIAKALLESRKAAKELVVEESAEPSPWQQERLDVLGRLTRVEREQDTMRPKVHQHDSLLTALKLEAETAKEDASYMRRRVDALYDR